MSTFQIPNPPEQISLDSFRSIAGTNGGFSKSSRFVARINDKITGPAGSSVPIGIVSDLSYLCESAEFPGRGLMTTDLRYYGPNFKAPFQSTYEDLNLTFICRDEFLEREYFDDWMEMINPSFSYDFSYPDTYTTRIDLFQISDLENKAKYMFSFDKAFPILINPQPVTWADDNFHRLTVTFTYRRWYREKPDERIESANPSPGSLIEMPGVDVKLQGGTILPKYDLTRSASLGGSVGSRPSSSGFLTGGGF